MDGGRSSSEDERPPSILTNMAFWQSPLWLQRTESIYDLRDRRDDPLPMPPWKEALALLRRSGPCDVVLTMGARESLAYGLLAAVLGRPSKQIMTEVFIDDCKPWCPLWQLKTMAFRWIAARSFGILTNSSPEMEAIGRRFRVSSAKLRFVPLNTTIAEPRPSDRNEGYILAAGRSLRDYRTLLDAAPRIHTPIRVVCGQRDLAGSPLPANVSLVREAARNEYLRLLEGATIVVVPLLPAERATGQVVVLEALSLGKPVVATRAAGTVDYVRDGENGLLVGPQDATALADAVNRLLGDPARAAAMGRAGFEDAAARFSIETHARLKLDAIRDLWRQARGDG
jgi:glycosyltransferase involved in cell wall biosynthesis